MFSRKEVPSGCASEVQVRSDRAVWIHQTSTWSGWRRSARKRGDANHRVEPGLLARSGGGESRSSGMPRRAERSSSARSTRRRRPISNCTRSTTSTSCVSIRRWPNRCPVLRASRLARWVWASQSPQTKERAPPTRDGPVGDRGACDRNGRLGAVAEPYSRRRGYASAVSPGPGLAVTGVLPLSRNNPEREPAKAMTRRSICGGKVRSANVGDHRAWQPGETGTCERRRGQRHAGRGSRLRPANVNDGGLAGEPEDSASRCNSGPLA